MADLGTPTLPYVGLYIVCHSIHDDEDDDGGMNTIHVSLMKNKVWALKTPRATFGRWIGAYCFIRLAIENQSWRGEGI